MPVGDPVDDGTSETRDHADDHADQGAADRQPDIFPPVQYPLQPDRPEKREQTTQAYREDESRIRKDHAPDNFAVLRHIALKRRFNHATDIFLPCWNITLRINSLC